MTADDATEGPISPLERDLAAVQPELDRLWAELALLARDHPERRTAIAFTGVERGAGATTLAAATALSLARRLGERIGLVEADCFAPALASYLGLDAAPGILDVLDGRADEDDAIRNGVAAGLTVVTAGTPRRVLGGELLSAPARSLFDRALAGRRIVVLDVPPVLAHPESRLLLEYADRAILVLRARDTKKRRAQEAIRAIRQAGIDVHGAVLNRFRSDLPLGFRGL